MEIQHQQQHISCRWHRRRNNYEGFPPSSSSKLLIFIFTSMMMMMILTNLNNSSLLFVSSLKIRPKLLSVDGSGGSSTSSPITNTNTNNERKNKIEESNDPKKERLNKLEYLIEMYELERKYNKEVGMAISSNSGEKEDTAMLALSSKLKNYYDDFLQYNNHKMIIHNRVPRDIWDGTVNAAKNVANGCWNGLCKFVDSCAEGGIVGAVPGVAHAMVYTAGGLVAGAYQLVQGSINTPTAISESKDGKIYDSHHGLWKDYYLNEEDIEINELFQKVQQHNHDNNRDYVISSSYQSRKLRNRAKRKVKDKEYYQMLNVPVDATYEDIKKAYRKEALRLHPDKNTGSGEEFQKVTSIMKILTNEESRKEYDTKGKCYVESKAKTTGNGNDSTGGADGILVDAYTFFAITFGLSDLIENYVGELKIISWLEHFLHLSTLSNNDNDETSFLDEFDGPSSNSNYSLLEQRRRVLDIALYLRNKIQPYVDGRITKAQFTKACQLEATAIASGDRRRRNDAEEDNDEGTNNNNLFATSFLITIGKSILLEADKYLIDAGGSSSGSSSTIGANIRQFGVAAIKNYESKRALLDSIVSYAGIVTKSIKTAEKSMSSCGCDDGDDSSTTDDHFIDAKLLMNKINVSKLIELVWKYTDYDIYETISNAVHKVLLDKVTIPILQLQRAEALSILGHTFLDMGQTFQLSTTSTSTSKASDDDDDEITTKNNKSKKKKMKMKMKKNNEQILKEQLGNAFFQAFLQKQQQQDDDYDDNDNDNSEKNGNGDDS